MKNKKTIVILNSIFKQASYILIEDDAGLHITQATNKISAGDLNEIAEQESIKLEDYKIVVTRENFKGNLDIERFED